MTVRGLRFAAAAIARSVGKWLGLPVKVGQHTKGQAMLPGDGNAGRIVGAVEREGDLLLQLDGTEDDFKARGWNGNVSVEFSFDDAGEIESPHGIVLLTGTTPAACSVADGCGLVQADGLTLVQANCASGDCACDACGKIGKQSEENPLEEDKNKDTPASPSLKGLTWDAAVATMKAEGVKVPDHAEWSGEQAASYVQAGEALGKIQAEAKSKQVDGLIKNGVFEAEAKEDLMKRSPDELERYEGIYKRAAEKAAPANNAATGFTFDRSKIQGANTGATDNGNNTVAFKAPTAEEQRAAVQKMWGSAN